MTLFLSALASSGMLYLSFFPMAWGWLAWFALVPWLALARAPDRPRRLYLFCWLASLPFAFGVSQWMRVADWRMYFAWLFGALWVSVHFPLALLLVRALDRRTRLPLALTLPMGWVAMEYMRGSFPGGIYALLTGNVSHDLPGGFGWYFLGHTQHDLAEVIQVADLGGAYAVSVLVAAVNGLLFEVWTARREEAPRYSRAALLAQAIAVSLLLAAALGYGVWQLRRETSEPGPRVALLQGNIDQRSRNSVTFGDEDAQRKAMTEQRLHFERLCELAMRYRPDLIVWPETSYPAGWGETAPGEPMPQSLGIASMIRNHAPTAHLLGMNSFVVGEDLKTRDYNSAILTSPKKPYAGRYDKVHRVLFGEFIPFKEWLTFLKMFMPYEADYGVEAGSGFTPFTLPGTEWTFGVMICFEATDASIARAYARQDVSFLANISNEGWFDGTSEHDEGLAICRFRAVESRRAVVRAVNMGISAVIDANGRVVDTVQPDPAYTAWVDDGKGRGLPVHEWGRFKKTACVVVARVPIDSRGSFYAKNGDVLCFAILGGMALLLVFGRGKP